MCELDSILKRSNLINLMSYLIYDVGSNGETIDNYKQRLEESYQHVIEEALNMAE